MGLVAEAEARKGGAKGHSTPKPIHLKFGLNHVTQLVEEGKAKLVVMAHDVDPAEIMVFLPTLFRKHNVPYAFIKGKARLGRLSTPRPPPVSLLLTLERKISPISITSRTT